MNLHRVRHWVLLFGCLGLLSGCSRDPNVRKQKYFESGQRYLRSDKYREAIIQFNNAIQADPGYAPAHYGLAKAYLKTQQWISAYKELSRTIELQPANYPAHLDLANLLTAGREFNKAQAEIRLLAEKQPDNAALHIATANLLMAENDLPAASREMNTAVALAPAQADAYLSLARLQMRMNQFDLAEANFKKATELNPKATEALLGLAAYYQARNRFPEAEQAIQRALAADAADPGPRSELVRLYMSEGNKTAAERIAKQSRDAFPRNSAGYRMLGDFYLASGNVDGALAEYADLYRKHANDIQVKKNYIQLLIVRNRLDEADKLNSELLKASSGDVDALIDRGQIQYRRGDPQTAQKTLQRALANDPSNGIAYYQLGLVFDQVGQPLEAEKAWQDAIRFRPDLTDAHLALAKTAIRQGDMRALQESAEQIVRLLPGLPDGYAFRALSLIRQGRLPQAELDAAQAIRVAPESPMGYLQMGNLRLAQKRYADAEGFYKQALEHDPGSLDALTGLIGIYTVRNRPEQALLAIQSEIAKKPASSALYDLLATTEWSYRKSSADLNSAESNLKKSVELDRKNVDAWMKLGQLEAARGASDDAIATIQQALQDNQDQPGLDILMGQLFESKQDLEKAKNCYQQALQIDPRQPLASNNLAYLLAQTGGNLDVALSLAQSARRALPDSPNAADTLGWVLYNKGAYRSAIDTFLAALRLSQRDNSLDNPALHFHLGLAYQKTGQFVLAREQFKRVLQINPGYSSAADAKKLLSQLR